MTITKDPPVLSCGTIDIIEVPAKTARGKAKTKQVWRMWEDNAEMIADVAKLWIDPTDRVLDPMYGSGNFWTRFTPKNFVHHDLRVDGFDARVMGLPGGKPYRANSFDAIVLDPPYVSQGGRDTSTIEGMQEAYGMYDAPRSPEEVQKLINEVMAASVERLRDGGRIMVKVMDYVSSGAIFDAQRKTKEEAEALGLRLVGEFFFSSGLPGPQPGINLNGTPRQQVHGRNNVSVLYVFRKPVARARKAVAPKPPAKPRAAAKAAPRKRAAGKSKVKPLAAVS